MVLSGFFTRSCLAEVTIGDKIITCRLLPFSPKSPHELISSVIPKNVSVYVHNPGSWK